MMLLMEDDKYHITMIVMMIMIMLLEHTNRKTVVPSEVEGDGTIIDFFATTVVMPTYLIAFAIQVLVLYGSSSTFAGLWFCGGPK